MYEFVGALLLAAVAGWLVGLVSNGLIDRAVAGFRELVGGWRGDGWPRGVQEEDRDQPWGSGQSNTQPPTLTPLIEPRSGAIATRHVRARTRSR